jgi:hypothetical protein
VEYGVSAILDVCHSPEFHNVKIGDLGMAVEIPGYIADAHDSPRNTKNPTLAITPFILGRYVDVA